MISFGTSDVYLMRWLFLRGMAVVWATAFLSLGVQIDGLAGPEGILPAGEYLDAVEAQGGRDLHQIPTVCWWTGTDTSDLIALCAVGVALAGLLAAGVAPGLVSLLLWAAYLSLTVVCTTFLNFQWDTLLLEAGLLAAFFAPWTRFSPGPAWHRPPSRVTVLLLRFLLFKLMFLSGLVKLTGGDPTWRGLTALEYHYWTTCLPTWTGWFAHQLPAWLHRASVAGMFVVEIGVPGLVFVPVRRVRLAAFGLLVALQVGIAATGNYGFFNLLGIVLCLVALDDRMLAPLLPGLLRKRLAPPPAHAWRGPFRQAPALILAAVVVPLSLLQMQGRFFGYASLPGFAVAALQSAQPFRSVNGYGLFASMTTTRREIQIEGSNDGQTWLPYAFRWKPGDPQRRPRFVQPHMPRLDWQMWFAALSEWKAQPWLGNFQVRLLEGSAPVLALLEANPFPDGPPAYVRARVWDYRFSGAATRRETGAWWVREEKGAYGPPLQLDASGRPTLARF